MIYRGQELDSKPKRLRHWILRVVLILILVGAGITGLVYRDTVTRQLTSVLAATEEDPVPVRALVRKPFQLEIPAYGEIVGMESIPVPTPRTASGSLKVAWLVPEGTFVNEGDTVVIFDKTAAQLSFEQQENSLAANIERTKVTTGQQGTNDRVLSIDRADAEMEYDYAVTVMPQDETIFSKWDIIEAQINADFAKDRIGFLTHKGRIQRRVARADQQILAIEKNKAQTEMEIARQTLNALELTSPAGGLLLYRLDRRREPQVGDESMPGQVLVEIIDLDVFQARIYVLERDAATLAKGKEVLIHLDSIPERQFLGTVNSVSGLAQSLERNSPLKYFTCDIAIRDVGDDIKRIKPGMALKAKIILEKYDSCFVVPASAVTVKGTESIVYIQEGDSFTARSIVAGFSTHGGSTILSGVEEGEMIALRNPFETRKAFLPDFSKGAGDSGRGRGRGMGGRSMRMIIGRPH